MEWKELRGQVYTLDADSTNPRPTARALKALVRYLDEEYFPDVASAIHKLEERNKSLQKRVESLEKIKK